MGFHALYPKIFTYDYHFDLTIFWVFMPLFQKIISFSYAKLSTVVGEALWSHKFSEDISSLYFYLQRI